MQQSHLNRGRDEDVEGVSLVKGFPISLNIAEISSRVLGPYLQDLQACVHLGGQRLQDKNHRQNCKSVQIFAQSTNHMSKMYFLLKITTIIIIRILL